MNPSAGRLTQPRLGSSSSLRAEWNPKDEATTIRQVSVERVSLLSSKPFDAIVGRIQAAIGHPGMNLLCQYVTAVTSFDRFVRRAADHGAAGDVT